MLLLKKNKKALIVTVSVTSLLVALILIAQIIIGGVIKSKVENAIEKKNQDNTHIISVDNVKVNLFTMTLILKGISISPDSVLFSNLKLSTSTLKQAAKISVKQIRVRNIGLFDFLFNKHISINDFKIKDAEICLYKAVNKANAEKNYAEKQSEFKPDSIVINGINGVSINKIILSNFTFSQINVVNNDTLLSTQKLDAVFHDVALMKNKNSNSFEFSLDNINIDMQGKKAYLPGGKYALSLDNINFVMDEKKLVLSNLNISPRFSRKKMVSLSKYNSEIYTCNINKIEANSFSIKNIIKNSNLIMSNIIVDSMNLEIFKDKRLPFDTLKRPMLPQQLLKKLKFDLGIDSILINNSSLTYSERHKDTKQLMEVSLGNLNIKIANISSMIDSIMHNEELAINLKAKLQNSIPMGINIYMPMKSIQDTFSFNGWLGKGNMKLFNNILLPAIGIKFNGGTLDGVKFAATANSTYSIGKITMLYHDLDGIVVKKDMKETNKFLSWVANAAMIKNNPIVNKKPRSEPMYFKRVTYKGLGNFLWKTIQSGITATLIPTMDNTVQKQIDVTLGTDKKTIRKRERAKRKRLKHNK